MARALTPKQAKFIEIYLANGRNGADAYRKAYDTAGSPQLCHAEGNRLLKHPLIAPRVRRAEERIEKSIETATVRAAERYAVSRERNIAELAKMAYANMGDFTRLIGPDRVVDLSATDRDALAAVQEITVEDYMKGRGEDAREVRRTKLRLADKQTAIERLNKMFGWIIERQEVGAPGDFANLSDEEIDRRLMEELMARGMTERQAKALLAADEGPPAGPAN